MVILEHPVLGEITERQEIPDSPVNRKGFGLFEAFPLDNEYILLPNK